MISRANGNSRRGHSISTTAFRLSCGTLRMRNTPPNSSSKRNIKLPPVSALPSSLSTTSMSVSVSGVALTLIWMPICGGS